MSFVHLFSLLSFCPLAMYFSFFIVKTGSLLFNLKFLSCIKEEICNWSLRVLPQLKAWWYSTSKQPAVLQNMVVFPSPKFFFRLEMHVHLRKGQEIKRQNSGQPTPINFREEDVPFLIMLSSHWSCLR